MYCPRTHDAFGHTPHPAADWLAAGGRVALGTDSLASNPDLDVLAEARWLKKKFTNFCDGATLLEQSRHPESLPLKVTVPANRVVPGKTWRITLSFAYCSDNLCIPCNSIWSVQTDSCQRKPNVLRRTIAP